MKRTLLLITLVATACGDAPTTTRAQRTEPARSASKPAKTLVKATPSEPTAPIPFGPGPLPTSDNEEVRRSAVLAVLAGGSAATTLPERADDPDHPFDAGLAGTMTPTAEGLVPRIRHGDVTVEGKLSKDIIRRIVRGHVGQIRTCYDQQLEREPKATGTLALTFTIGPGGEMTASGATSKALDPLMTTCVQGHLKRWRFPSPENGQPVAVKYGLELTPY